MNSPTDPCRQLEADVERLGSRLPELPSRRVLTSRLLLHIGRGLSTLLEHTIRPFGLTEAEFRVLTTLYSQADAGAHPTDVCSKTSQSPANMSRISDTLVARDLITRAPSVHDRRKMILRITPHGEDMVRRLLPLMWAPLAGIFKDFSDDQLQTLVGQLKVLSGTVDAEARQEAARGG